MSDSKTPSTINYHRKSAILRLTYTDGRSLELSSEYLRTQLDRTAAPFVTPPDIAIDKIEPDSDNSLRIDFNDGYSSQGVTWKLLYTLGADYEKNWQQYLASLKRNGLQRHEAQPASIDITLLYFTRALLQVSNAENEKIQLPAGRQDVRGLLATLRRRGEHWQQAFAEDKVQVTVNKQFAELFTRLEAGDEVALVPAQAD